MNPINISNTEYYIPMKRTVKVYIDDEKQPLKEFSPPANFTLDTTRMTDGEHTLKVIATSSDGVEGIKTIDFVVRNGPQIEVTGLNSSDVVSDQIDLGVNAYGSENQESFIVAGSETPKAVPAWLWVILIGFGAWATFYLLTFWNQ